MPTFRPFGGSGGGGGSANVAWGPSWGNGDGDEYGVRTHVSLPALDLTRDQSIGVTPILWALAQDFNAQSVAASQASTLAPAYAAQTIGVDPSGVLGPAYTNLVATQPTMPALALAHSKSIGVDITGSALGAPLFQSVTTAVTSSNSVTLVLPNPASIQNGDFLLFLVGTGNVVQTITGTPAGTTLIRNDIGGAAVSASSYYKIANNESGSYTFTASGNCAWAGTCMLIRGVDQTTPINVHGATVANSQDPIAPSITTTTANTLVVAWCAQSQALSASYTPPAGYTERSDLSSTQLGVTVLTSSTNTKIQAATGATGTATMDSTQVSGTAYVAQHIAIATGSITIA